MPQELHSREIRYFMTEGGQLSVFDVALPEVTEVVSKHLDEALKRFCAVCAVSTR